MRATAVYAVGNIVLVGSDSKIVGLHPATGRKRWEVDIPAKLLYVRTVR